MTYVAKTRPITSNKKKILEKTEMKIARKIAGKTLLDKERSEDIKNNCNINEWVLDRKHEGNEHINRMDEARIVRAIRDKPPNGRKRWSDNLTKLKGTKKILFGNNTCSIDFVEEVQNCIQCFFVSAFQHLGRYLDPAAFPFLVFHIACFSSSCLIPVSFLPCWFYF